MRTQSGTAEVRGTSEVKVLDQRGRVLGPRALQTRRGLLDATAALLEQQRVRDVSVVEIARRAGTSPATFYQYFKDVSEATLHLAEQAAGEMPALVELMRSWEWGMLMRRRLSRQSSGR